jgi:hypothetical protein
MNCAFALVVVRGQFLSLKTSPYVRAGSFTGLEFWNSSNTNKTVSCLGKNYIPRYKYSFPGTINIHAQVSNLHT